MDPGACVLLCLGIKVSMCCLRGALGPGHHYPMSAPGYFQLRSEERLWITVRISRGTQHPPSRYVKWQEHWQSEQKRLCPGLFRLLLSTHWLHTGTGNTNTRSEPRPESSWCNMCVCVRAQSGPLQSLSNYPKWLSREASECLSAPLCDKTLFVCLCLRESFIKSRSWIEFWRQRDYGKTDRGGIHVTGHYWRLNFENECRCTAC